MSSTQLWLLFCDMATEWWQMPGPATLIERVVRDLESGLCAVVSLPEYGPPDFRQAVKRVAQRPNAQRDWYRITELPLPDQSLAEWLWEQWLPSEDNPCPPNLTVAKLLAQPSIPSGAICELPSLKQVNLTKWLRFMGDYQQALQQIARQYRIVLLVVVEEGASLTQLPRLDQPQLTFHRYQQQATRLDMLLFLTQALRPTVPLNTPIERELRINCAAALFPTDPVLALQSAESGPFDPSALQVELENQQRQRGWPSQPTPTNGSPDSDWAHGLVGYADGQPEIHLCAPHAGSLTSRIRRSLWLAQVRVLLPWMEQQRWRLLHIPDVKRYLRSELQSRPYEKQFDGRPTIIIQEPEKLEFAHILAVICRRHKPQANAGYLKSSRLHNQLELLRDRRNDLSHLSPLTEYQVVELLAVVDLS